jgi:hypothetical protein
LRSAPERGALAPCPTKPYLLIDYTNLYIAPNMADAYAKALASFQAMILGTFRFNVAADFTGVAVALGNLKLSSSPNIFSDEAAARQAIERARGVGK